MASRLKLHPSNAALVLSAALLLIWAGCGDDNESVGAPPTATHTSTATVAPATSTPTVGDATVTTTPTGVPTVTATPTVDSGGDESETEFLASLDGDQEVPPVPGLAAGTASFILSADRTAIDFVVNIEGLDVSEITQSHLHVAPRGFNGPVVVPLTGAPSSLPLAGTVTADDLVPNAGVGVIDFDDLIEAMLAGDVYVNVHTMDNPAGEIRGQLRGPTTFSAYLSGDQEVPPVVGMPGGTVALAAGTAALTANAAETEIQFEVAIEGIAPSQITQAHLHVAPPGVNGPPIIFLTGSPPFTLPLTGTLTEAGLLPNTVGIDNFADLIAAMEAGDVYVNVHTMDYPDGEIRGQVDAAVLLTATLDGDQEVEPVETDATGKGQVVVSADRRSLRFALSVFDLPVDQITQAHIHVGAAGVNGPVVLFLAHESFTSPRIGTLTPTNLIPAPAAGVETFDDFLDALFAGNTYMNVHSMTHMGGEVRGQLLLPE
jgi:hypothetical protein